jgi:serine/threonine protein kinase
MQQCRRAAGPMPLPIALEILIQLCDALDHAHELRDAAGRSLDLVHRDVTPSNVMTSRDGLAKLIDFGIPKARTTGRATQHGIIKGKHAYVAPEYTYGQLDPPRKISASPFVLVALIAFAALAVANGWIDIDAWRNLFA